MNNEFLKELRETRPTYADMVEFCTDNLILNNDIMNDLTNKGYYFELYCSSDYNEQNDTFVDIYQYYIIDEQGAERFAEYTNEIVYYCEELDLYILGVTHCGTPWRGVDANWKEDKDIEEEND